MKRRHSRAQAIAFCRALRRLRPDIVFGADLIAGFPTETVEMFRRSLDLVEECDLTYLHVFPFSARPSTPAARMPQLDRATIKERAGLLRHRGAEALRRHLQREVGATRRILAESGYAGRTEHFTTVRLAAPVEPGSIVERTIAGHDGGQLLAAKA
jgi:threonylcarbamoyladenosine tRNA methylthiotransferase MtaB